MNKIEEIKKLKSLLDEGAITEGEFQMLKKKLINQDSTSINEDVEPKKKAVKQDIRPTSRKKKVENVPKPILFKIGIGLSIILGFVFLIRYDSFIPLLIIITFAIGGLFGINKMVLHVTKQNLLLGVLNILLVGLIIVPIGNVTDLSSSSSSDSTDDIAYMKCRYCGKGIVEKNNKGIMCFTSEPDGIGVLTFYSGSKYDVYCSEECAKKGILVGYGYTDH